MLEITWRVSPNVMQRRGMEDPHPKATVRPKMTRKASRGVENLNWNYNIKIWFFATNKNLQVR